MKVRTGLGQDSHRFAPKGNGKPLKLGGLLFEGEDGLEGNSDADVVLHALCNAISSITGHSVIGPVADSMCQAGITDSSEYLKTALKSLGGGQKISHVAVSIEGKRPKIHPHNALLRASIARLLNLAIEDVGVTATSGEGLTSFGKGEGIQALVLLTVMEA
jgi:2-C-methyl-D-erythritol 2,4-cyclodiphosphate synthase